MWVAKLNMDWEQVLIAPNGAVMKVWDENVDESIEEVMERAKLMARACTYHEELLGALESMVRWHGCYPDESTDRAKAIIAKVRG